MDGRTGCCIGESFVLNIEDSCSSLFYDWINVRLAREIQKGPAKLSKHFRLEICKILSVRYNDLAIYVIPITRSQHILLACPSWKLLTNSIMSEKQRNASIRYEIKHHERIYHCVGRGKYLSGDIIINITILVGLIINKKTVY